MHCKYIFVFSGYTNQTGHHVSKMNNTETNVRADIYGQKNALDKGMSFF